MPQTNKQLVERADLAISNLTTDGGLLQPTQSAAFIDMILDQPTILPQARVIRMTAPEMKIPRLGFDKRILHGANQAGGENDDGSNSRRLAAAKRSKPTTSQISLITKELIAEVRIPYEVLEDNIEGQSFDDHVMRLIAERAAVDLEEFALFADKTIDPGVDDLLCLDDGWLKRASAHVVSNGAQGVNFDVFTNALLAMPQRYMRYLNQLRAFVSPANTIRYRRKIADRLTGYGDSAMQSNIPLFAGGLQIEGAPSLAADGVGNQGLVTFPKNLIFGIRRDITVETDREIRAREWVVVLTTRVGLQIDDVGATVKLEDL